MSRNTRDESIVIIISIIAYEEVGMMTVGGQIVIKHHLFDLGRLDDGESVKKMISDIVSLLGYDFRIGELNYDWFARLDQEEKVSKLGQVFTPPYVAQLISDLCIQSPDDQILDPCFGGGVFLNTALTRLENLSGRQDIQGITGVELDPILFIKGLSAFFGASRHQGDTPRNFYNGSIFEFAKSGFDAIIFNPPYVRQEDLDEGPHFLDKQTLISRTLSDENPTKLPGRSNLYSYFVVYLERLLRPGGLMGMVTSNAWLDSRFGRALQEFLLKNFVIEYVIDFNKDSFLDVNVEDCVLIAKKNDDRSKVSGRTKFVHVKRKMPLQVLERLLLTDKNFDDEDMNMTILDSKDLAEDYKWRKYLYVPGNLLNIIEKKLIPLSNVAKVDRGLTTGWNEFFIMDEAETKRYALEEHSKPIIGSPKDLLSYNTSDARLSRILFINKPLDKDAELGLQEYVHDSLGNQDTEPLVKGRKDWYVINNLKSGSIIFGYIIRKTKAFILNRNKIPARDNFYCISPEYCDTLLLFGILNSSLCRAMLELAGRRYGRGLLKVQAYELEKLPIPDPRWMPKRIKDMILVSANKLAASKINEPANRNTIREIDLALCEYLDNGLTPEQLAGMERELSTKRLSKVNPTKNENHDSD